MKALHSLSVLLLCLTTIHSFAQMDSLSQQQQKDSIKVIYQRQQEAQYIVHSEARELLIKKLSQIPSDSVFKLDISNLAFRTFPDITRFTNITAINASRNQLTEIVLSKRNTESIKSIDIRNNKIEVFKLGKAPQLKTLFIGDNPISKIPSSLLWNHQLKRIDISNTSITVIPWWVKYKRNIKEILMYRNDICLSKKNIRRLRHIETLQLAQMRIDSLPPYFIKIKNLKRLTIAYCGLHDLPENIGELKQLEVLILYQDAFSEIPKSCYNLTNLVHLDFYYNKINSIPAGISQMKNLEELYLSFNQISILPPEIQNLNKLRVLHVHHNNIEELPSWVSKLSNLEILDLGYNDIEKLPDLSPLNLLNEVDFQENKLTKFPFQLLELPKTKLIFLGNNPFNLTTEEQKKLSKLSKLFAERKGELILFEKD